MFLSAYGTTEEAAEKVVPDQTVPPQRLKPDSEQSSYGSAEALRHPKSSPRLSFSAACEVAPFPKPTRHNECRKDVGNFSQFHNPALTLLVYLFGVPTS